MILTHVELSHKAGEVVMLKVEREYIPCQDDRVMNTKRGSILQEIIKSS